ncbi:hypothetical protein [Amycolatopsis nigrescens]|uniref:hypothetical protein n=1 Tax=Amycolatopsis nigrescens TaxID=381445 RepID=UPI0003603600|nr:hypothetical protein [Amycolatopsis nigrescens]
MRTTSREARRPAGVPPAALSYRERAILLAVRDHRALITGSSEPDLLIDGLYCCDQAIAHALFHHGWIRPALRAAVSDPVPAELTPDGRAALLATAAGDTPVAS